MALELNVSDVTELAEGMWGFHMPPHQVRLLGEAGHALGAQSVVLIEGGDFDSVKQHLRFAFESATPINIGTTSQVIGLSIGQPRREIAGASSASDLREPSFGPGDQEFLQMAHRELSPQTAQAAEALLRAVRARSPGNLKRGQSRNFSETPDNFWYVIVQPRIDELSITVRGTVEHFSSIAKLEVKDDRGNTRFKVASEVDVPAALDLIFHAHRKR